MLRKLKASNADAFRIKNIATENKCSVLEEGKDLWAVIVGPDKNASVKKKAQYLRDLYVESGYLANISYALPKTVSVSVSLP